MNEARAVLRARPRRRRAELEPDGRRSAPRRRTGSISRCPGRRPSTGSLHPFSLARTRSSTSSLRLGYRVVEGPEVEDEWHNFDALNIPPDHPGADLKDSIFVNIPGHPELLLRTETSSVQIRTLQSQPPPVAIIAPGRVYRNESPTPTHLPVFHQVEGLVVDEGITFADLKGTLDAFARALFGEERQTSSARRSSRSWSRAPSSR